MSCTFGVCDIEVTLGSGVDQPTVSGSDAIGAYALTARATKSRSEQYSLTPVKHHLEKSGNMNISSSNFCSTVTYCKGLEIKPIEGRAVVAVIGAGGRMGRVRATALHRHPQARVKYALDVDINL